MRHVLNLVWHIKPGTLILLGITCIGISMVAFAWVTWPNGFEGIVKTFSGLLTGLLHLP